VNLVGQLPKSLGPETIAAHRLFGDRIENLGDASHMSSKALTHLNLAHKPEGNW
jgi:hypothetical protein